MQEFEQQLKLTNKKRFGDKQPKVMPKCCYCDFHVKQNMEKLKILRDKKKKQMEKEIEEINK